MAKTVSLPPTIRADDEGERRWFFGGGVHTWKVTPEETGGAFMLFEARMERGKATPLHTHDDSDETTYVLEGEIRMHLAGQESRLTTGGLAVAPRGVPHAFLVVSDVARLLFLHTPGCCQDFYWDASEPVAAGAAPSGPVDFSRVHASAEKNGGMRVVGPPPFAAGS